MRFDLIEFPNDNDLGKGLASFELAGMCSKLVSCSCEALQGSLLPASVAVNYIVNNKGRCGQHCTRYASEKMRFCGSLTKPFDLTCVVYSCA